MNVLHIRDCINTGGTERLLLNICNADTSKYFNLHFISFLGGTLEKDFEKSNCKYQKYQRHSKIDLIVIKRLRKYVKENGIDVIHSHQLNESLYSLIATIGLRIKRIHTVHGFYHVKKKYTIQEKIVLSFFSKIVTVSNYVKSYMVKKGYGREKLITVYNPVFLKNYWKNDNDKKFNHKLNSVHFIIGMVGNFTEVKDHYTLINAFYLFNKKYVNSNLVLIGNTNRKLFKDAFELVKRLNIQNDVVFTGERSDISNMLSNLNVFALSSKFDTFGISAVEAMLAKVPVIMTDIPALREISCDGKYAILVPPNDETALCDAIEKIYNKEVNSEEMTRNAKEYAEMNYSVEKHLEGLREVYEKVMGDNIF